MARSLRRQVFDLYLQNKDIQISDIRLTYPLEKPEVLSNYLYEARKEFPKSLDKLLNLSEESLRDYLIELLNKDRSPANIRLWMEYLKLTNSSAGMDTDLDFNKFLKEGSRSDTDDSIEEDRETSLSRTNITEELEDDSFEN